MSAEYATFGLAPAMRPGGVHTDGVRQVHRDFMDFIVDGRPLLFRLSDLDAVSPLASDIPPAIFTDHVRRLLLDAEAPLADGRYVIYGCPECEGLDCGAVTAVIERVGEDVVWRDFAWQTDTTADLELNGYHGIGPFRFRGTEYRQALEQLLPDPGSTALRRRVLLIGARVAFLARLAAALRTIGIGAEIAHDLDDVPADELRTYGVVVLGRAVGERERAAVRDALTRAGADVEYVEVLAPVLPLLVARIEQALDRSPADRRRLTALSADEGTVTVEVTSACRVRLVAYHLGRLHRTRTQEIFDGTLEPGSHRIRLDPKAVAGRSYLVARTTGGVLVAEVEC